MTRAILLLGLLAAASCSAPEAGFEPLFDGETLEGWTLVPRAKPAGAWRVDEATLTVDGKPGVLASDRAFGDFDLRLEWKVGPQGNSGVFYRVPGNGRETAAAIEYQLADNARQASQEHANRRAGAAYGLYAPSEDASLPPGEWNTARIVARGPRVQHWLNGRQVVDLTVATEDFADRARAKFPKVADFAGALRGRIVLQDHGDTVWFRNIRVKELDPAGDYGDMG